MRWSDVVIEDLKGKTYTGTEAQDYALDNLPLAEIMVRSYKADTFALMLHKTKALVVAPDQVQKALLDGLNGKIAKVTVAGAAVPTISAYVPCRGPVYNPINVKPRYIIKFELGDIDALFEPINSGTAEPWKELGVQQRMQALGYFYTPLGHPKKDEHAKLCWEYYRKKVHTKPSQAAPDDSSLIAILKKEIQNNLVAPGFPVKGQIFDDSKLPPPGSMAAVRFPGGYTINFPRMDVVGPKDGSGNFINPPLTVRQKIAGDFVRPGDALGPFDFGLGDDRFKAEDAVFSHNELMGKLPLIAKITCDWGEGKITYPKDVPVYFQLVMPDPLIPPEDPGGSRFCAPKLRNTLMNYGKNWTVWEDNKKPSKPKLHPDLNNTSYRQITIDLTDDLYAAAHVIAHNAIAQPAGATRDSFITGEIATAMLPLNTQVSTLTSEIAALNTAKTTAAPPDIGAIDSEIFSKNAAKKKAETTRDKANTAMRTAVNWILSHAPDPVTGYEMTAPGNGLGQRKFVQNILDNIQQAALGTDANDPQQLNCPSQYGGKSDLPVEGADATRPGVFENSTAQRPGFHTKRPAQATDYGVLNLATVPADRTKHPYAMECKTNDKGIAGVIFMPSRVGGDAYKLRAYIDPEWLKTHADGPVHQSVEVTGTMVVWRNIRLGRYIQKQSPPTPYSADVMEMLNFSSGRWKAAKEKTARAQAASTAAKQEMEEAKKELQEIDNELTKAESLPDSDSDKQSSVDALLNQVALARTVFTSKESAYQNKGQLLRQAIEEEKNPTLNQAYTIGDEPFERMYLTHPVIDLKVFSGDSRETPYRKTDPRKIDTGISEAAWKHYRPIDTPSLTAEEQFRRCYCEWIVDCDGIEPVDPNELRDAIQKGRDAARLSGEVTVVPAVDWNTLVFHDPTSPFLVNQRAFEHYNKLISDRGETATYPVLDRRNVAAIPDQFVNAFYYFIDYMMQHFAGGGVLPGLTLIQVPRAESWDARAVSERTVTTSGYGAPCRCALVSHTKPVYEGDQFCYSATSNAVHELGHVLGLPHQDPYPGFPDSLMHQGQPPAAFRTPQNDDCICLMGYYGCYGELCGRCVLTLRGWKTLTKNYSAGA